VSGGFSFAEGCDGFFDQLPIRLRVGRRGVLSEEQNAAGVGDFGVWRGASDPDLFMGLSPGLLGEVEGLAGFGELVLIDVEAGEGCVDFGDSLPAGRVAGSEGEGCCVVFAGLPKLMATACEMAEVEAGGDAG